MEYPSYNHTIDRFELDDQDQTALEKFNKNQNIKYRIPYFKNPQEIEEFFNYYWKRHAIKKSTAKSYLEIYEETDGHPIMVKFFLLGEGLRKDVKKRYGLYLIDSTNKEPIAENIQTIIICALFSISNYPITDKILTL